MTETTKRIVYAQFNFVLHEGDALRIAALSQALGIHNKSDIMRLALKRLAVAEGIEDAPKRGTKR